MFPDQKIGIFLNMNDMKTEVFTVSNGKKLPYIEEAMKMIGDNYPFHGALINDLSLVVGDRQLANRLYDSLRLEPYDRPEFVKWKDMKKESPHGPDIDAFTKVVYGAVAGWLLQEKPEEKIARLYLGLDTVSALIYDEEVLREFSKIRNDDAMIEKIFQLSDAGQIAFGRSATNEDLPLWREKVEQAIGVIDLTAVAMLGLIIDPERRMPEMVSPSDMHFFAAVSRFNPERKFKLQEYMREGVSGGLQVQMALCDHEGTAEAVCMTELVNTSEIDQREKEVFAALCGAPAFAIKQSFDDMMKKIN